MVPDIPRPHADARTSLPLGALFGVTFGFCAGGGPGWLWLLPLPLDASPRPFPGGAVLLFGLTGMASAWIATRPVLHRLRVSVLAAAAAAAFAPIVASTILLRNASLEVLALGVLLMIPTAPIIAVGEALAVRAKRGRAESLRAGMLFSGLAAMTGVLVAFATFEGSADVFVARDLDRYAHEQDWSNYRLYVKNVDSGFTCAAVRLEDGSVVACSVRYRGLLSGNVHSCASITPEHGCVELLEAR